MINARAETGHEKSAYCRAFKSQRALIPVDAFYEWLETDQVGKSGNKLKQPFALPVNCTKHSTREWSWSGGTGGGLGAARAVDTWVS